MAAILLVGIAKAGFGGGVGVIATPLVALTIPVSEAAALMLPLLILADLFTLRQYHHSFDRTSIKLMLPGALVGILLGGLLFGFFSHNERMMEIIIGMIALLFVLFQATRAIIFGMLEQYRPPAAVGVLMGAAAGFTSTLVHAGAPPTRIYLLPQKLPRDVFVGTSIIFFAIVNVVKLIPYSYLGLLRVGNLTTIALLAPLCYIGVKLGVRLNGRFSEYWFNIFVYVMLFLTGVQLVLGQSLIGLVFG